MKTLKTCIMTTCLWCRGWRIQTACSMFLLMLWSWFCARSGAVVLVVCFIHSSMALQPFIGPGRFSSFVILYTIGRTPWTGDQPITRSLPTHRTTQTQNKRTQTSMPWLGFKPTIPAFERSKIAHALDRAAAVMYVKYVLLLTSHVFTSPKWSTSLRLSD
jgi:hypothetical protein